VFDGLTGSAFGAACALASAFTWALTSLLVRRLGNVCSMMTVNAVRTSASGLLLFAIVIASPVRAELAAMSGTTLVLLVSATVLAAGIGDSVFFECARVLGLGRAMTLAMTYPLMAAAFATVFLREPITLRSAAGAVTTVAGLALIVSARRDDGGTHRRQRLMVLLSFFVAFTWAASAIMTKPAMRELSPLAAQSFRMPILAAFLWLMPWSRAGLPGFVAAGRSMVAPMLVLSALTVVSAMTWIAGLKYADVIVATVLSSTSPMFALGLGALFLGERLSVAAVLGAFLAIAGIVVLDI
jgi:DME family drug/metabolite transporter